VLPSAAAHRMKYGTLQFYAMNRNSTPKSNCALKKLNLCPQLTLKHTRNKIEEVLVRKKLHVANISHPVAHIDVEMRVRMSPELKARLKKVDRKYSKRQIAQEFT